MLNETQLPASRVPIAEGDATPTRAWFRFFSSLYNFVGLGSGVVPETSGGTGNVAYAAGDLLYAPTANTLARLAAPGIANPSYLGTDGTNMPQWIDVAYGAFYDSTTQTATANTPTAITLNATSYHNLIDIGTPTSRVVVTNAGTYNITFSVQFTNTSTTGEDDVLVWLKTSAGNIAYSASHLTINKRHGGVDGTALMTVDFYQQLAAGAYFELYWLSKSGLASISTIPSSASPSYPAAPGVILTVSQII